MYLMYDSVLKLIHGRNVWPSYIYLIILPFFQSFTWVKILCLLSEELLNLIQERNTVGNVMKIHSLHHSLIRYEIYASYNKIPYRKFSRRFGFVILNIHSVNQLIIRSCICVHVISGDYAKNVQSLLLTHCIRLLYTFCEPA